MRQRRVVTQPQEGQPHEVVNPHMVRAGRHRRPRSVTSNNSSLSSYSPPWTMTHRPQSQSTAWPGEDDDDDDIDALTEDGDRSVAAVPVSSWQEEAHWMSFRNAVQYFATMTIQEVPTNNVNDSLGGSSSSMAAVSSTSEHPAPPVRHIGLKSPSTGALHTNDTPLAVTNPDSPNLDVTLGGASSFSNSTVGDKGDSKSSNENTSKKEEQSVLKSMASDLAETRMRLALAQAERDELEFALMMSNHSESRSISGA